MRALFLSLPLHGHTNPTLPLVRELVRRGEDVVYYSTGAFSAKIEETGSQYRSYANAFLSDMRELPERMEQLSYLLMRATSEVLIHELDAFRATAPDYVITDSVAPWGQWAGEALDVPVVTSIPTCAVNRHVLAYGLARGVRPASTSIFFSKLRQMLKTWVLARQVKREHDLRGPGLLKSACGSSDLNIVYTSRFFQPCAESFDDRFLFIGPSSAPRTESAHFPWEKVQRPTVVYVSLGTLFNASTAFYRDCFAAFRDEDCQVILSIGANVAAADLGPPPPTFIVKSHVPQLEVLQRASAFVTHGGMNSVSESFLCGVPVVVVPHIGEQQVIGRRVEELGAGLYVPKAEATAERLRDSVRRVLTERTFRERAAVLRKSFEAAGGVSSAADAILRFTRRESPAPSRSRL